MAQKRFDEYFAKVVLESCFPEKFSNLQILDKPDLRCGNTIGIEVTNCMPKEAAEAFNLWHRVEKQGEQTPPRILERLEQLKDTVHLEGNSLVWETGDWMEEFFVAVKNKVGKLNSAKADYANMRRYELFVNSFIMVPYWMINKTIQCLQNINCKSKRFDIIYLVSNEQKLLIFNMQNNTLQEIYLYSRLDRMADKAIALYKGAKQ